ncbi:putative bifunctional diguanylate cyclase/phosphodiesterase [Humitalea sp. 24SJ18S-53]|uniref:putative bifunctional diguanylate cyclase/phosphodiesterase n=1 Tax=Humitalea sp. 24SJ18S-53 TaxID=3422307 RepID=UPI003D6660E9
MIRAASTQPNSRATDPRPGITPRTDRRRQDPGAHALRRAITACGLGFALLAALAIGATWTFAQIQQDHARFIGTISLANDQRVQAHRIGALAAEATPDPVAIATAAQRFATAHAGLTAGPAAPAQATPALAAHYMTGESSFDSLAQAFLREAQALDDPDALRRLAIGPIAAAVATAIELHTEAATASEALAQQRHDMAMLLMLLALIAVAMLVITPLVRHVASLASRLDREATLDPLTGLLNRRAISTALDSAMAAGLTVAVLSVDLDWFKETNEAEGHAGGDALLCAAAERIRGAVRREDVVGRLGGDEFVAVLIGVDDHLLAEGVAERLCDALHQPVRHEGRLLRLGATLGVAVSPLDATSPAVLMRAADDALLRTKRASRGGYGRATPTDTARIERDAAILRAMGAGEGALEGLDIHLQPIVSLADPATVLAFEALARWTTPALGDVSPEEFIPVAQRIGRLPWLGAQVRGAALRGFAQLRAAGLPSPLLAFNLSAAEIMRGDVVEAIEQDVAAAGLSLACIEIEITEEILLDRVSSKTLDQLAALRGRGARLALDDFGTGNSGLAQLLRLPLDKVKLDRTFIRGLGSDRRAEEVVRATLSMARSLGLDVVAEGVETEAQAATLRALGCTAAQGFLYAQPMDLAALQAWLATPTASVVVPLRSVARMG